VSATTLFFLFLLFSLFVVTSSFDDHQIQVWNKYGYALNLAARFKQIRTGNKGKNITFGQKTPTWTNKTTDDYQWKTGATGSCYANPCNGGGGCFPGGDQWMQFTQSPISIIDIDSDGKPDLVGVPNSEVQCPYITQQHNLFVSEGAYGNGWFTLSLLLCLKEKMFYFRGKSRQQSHCFWRTQSWF
jgi:hypothetical protein